MKCSKCNTHVSSNEKYCYKCGNKIEKEIIENTNNNSNINLKKESEVTNNNNHRNNTEQMDKDTTFNQIGEKISKNSKNVGTFIKDKSEKICNKIKTLGKIQKIIIVSLSVLFIAGMTVVSIPQSQDKVVNQFEEAIINDKADKLKNIVVSSDKRLKITEENLQAIIEYYKENPSNLNSDIQYLKDMYPGEAYGENPFNVVKNKVMLKEKYYINVNPRYMKLESSYKDVQIDLYSGEELIEENLKSGEIGPFIPGKYKLIITCSNEFTQAKSSKEIDIFYGELTTSVNMEGTINNNKIESDELDAVIYINDKSTNKTAKEINYISGLKNGDRVYGILKRNDKSIKSNVVQVDGSYNIYLNYEYVKPPTTEEVRDAVSTLMYDYLYYFADAVNYSDFYYIEEYLSVGSELYNTQKENVPKFYDKGISERYVNHEIVDIQYNEDDRKGSVTVKEVYEIFKDDEYNEKVFNNKYEFVFNEIDKTYKLTKLLEIN